MSFDAVAEEACRQYISVANKAIISVINKVHLSSYSLLVDGFDKLQKNYRKGKNVNYKILSKMYVIHCEERGCHQL